MLFCWNLGDIWLGWNELIYILFMFFILDIYNILYSVINMIVLEEAFLVFLWEF